MHDVVEVVDCDAAVSPCFSGYATEAVLAFAAGFISASSGEETRWHIALADEMIGEKARHTFVKQ